jgi:RNase H-like domain found in reverse transcriptase/Reverse transcriptase (RNA-dependent DNA polymerase)
VNSVSVGDAFPTEDVKEIVSWIATKCWYSVLDLRDGYWNITLCEESRPFTAVKTVVGLVEYTRMTMGLKNASAFFQRVIKEKYKGIKGEILAAYQEDLNIGSETVAKHLVDVRKVLQRTRDAKLRLKLPKYAFGRSEAAVLGHQVSLGKIKPGVEHQNTMARFREPTNGSELLRFLGVLNFFGEFIEDGALRMAPLYDVLVGTGWNKKKKRRDRVRIADWERRWGEEQKCAFEDLRDCLAAPEFLVPSRNGARKKLVTDASKYGSGVTLVQEEGSDRWLPIAFGSRKMKGAEVQYTTT